MADPGWYLDPHRQAAVRWWDGQAWTGHVDQRNPVLEELWAAARGLWGIEDDDLDGEAAAEPGTEVELTGTNTNGAEALQRLRNRHGGGEHGHWLGVAALWREPSNTADETAIAVVVEGERVAYLPSWLSSNVTSLQAGAQVLVPVQLFTRGSGAEQRSRGSAWLGPGAPRWKYTAQHRPPMTPREQEAADHHEAVAARQAERVAGGRRGATAEAGTVDGIHFLDTVHPIKELKRQGRFEEAARLCEIAITGAERHAASDGSSVPPFYTHQAAIVYRKLGDRAAEIAVLERYLQHIPESARHDHDFAQRLRKLHT